jgi:hypothetical protein
MMDAGGDGICCAFGEGSYDLRANGVNFFTSSGQYGGLEVVEFTLNSDGTGTVVSVEGEDQPDFDTPSGFNIELVPAAGFDPNSQPALVQALQDSAARWEQVIVGDLPDVNGVDDLRIQYDFSPIDGRGRIIGQAGPRRVRGGSLLPFEGVMTFDSDDVGRLSRGELDALFLHEMGHVLGIGTLWTNLGCSNCPNQAQYNPTGRCPSAANAFRNTPGRNAGAELLIEQDGRQGTACGHFDEVQLQSELMTGFLTTNPNTGISELSTITVGTLRDMGYTVNANAADDFRIPQSNLNSEEGIDLTHDMDDMPSEMDVVTVDDEQDMEMEDLNEMMNRHNSAGLIAGIAVGAVACVALVAGGVLYTKRQRGDERSIALV